VGVGWCLQLKRGSLGSTRGAVTYFPDLTAYSFLPAAATPPALNVGWLDPPHPFDNGATEPTFHERLFVLCQRPLHRTRGFHRCGFCVEAIAGTAHRETRNGTTVVLGSAEIRVAADGITYAAPDLIYHYVIRHRYRPPVGFIRAVLATG
jgi:hypothetical protein